MSFQPVSPRQVILDMGELKSKSASMGIPLEEFITLTTTDLRMLMLREYFYLYTGSAGYFSYNDRFHPPHSELVDDLFPDLWNDGLAGCQDLSLG